jgi:hypothetical protein
MLTSTLIITPRNPHPHRPHRRVQGGLACHRNPRTRTALNALRQRSHDRKYRLIDSHRRAASSQIGKSPNPAGAFVEIKSFSTSRDEQEVAGYAEVMELVFSASGTMFSFTENHIQQLHRDLLIYSEKRCMAPREAIRRRSNSVSAFDAAGAGGRCHLCDRHPVRYAPTHGRPPGVVSGQARDAEASLHPLLAVSPSLQ